MLNTPFPPWPSYTDEESAAVQRVLTSNRVNYWTGDECRAFEDEFAEYVGTRHGIALSNGTVALELALIALGVGPGQEVIVPSRTYFATASSVVRIGAVPVFADVDPDSGNLTAQTMAAVLSPRVTAVIVVHLGGWPCDMDPILSFAKAHSLHVVEDCAQAHGARYKGRSVGSIGDVGAWSFCQDKIITTGGEGGMITTDDPELWERIWSLKDHGKNWRDVYERKHPPGFRWLHDSFGTNARLTEMQAVIGRIQLGRMTAWTAARTSNAGALRMALAPFAGPGGPIRLPEWPALYGNDSTHAFYRFYAYVKPDCLAEGWSRDRLIDEIMARGIPCFHGSCSEVYLERAFQGSNWKPAQRLPTARQLGETSLAFLVHPTLGVEEMERARAVLDEVLSQAMQPSHHHG